MGKDKDFLHDLLKKCFFISIFFLIHCCSYGQVKIGFKTSKIPKLKSTNNRLFVAGNFNKWRPADAARELKKDAGVSYILLKNSRKDIYNFKVTRGSWETVDYAA